MSNKAFRGTSKKVRGLSSSSSASPVSPLPPACRLERSRRLRATRRDRRRPASSGLGSRPTARRRSGSSPTRPAFVPGASGSAARSTGSGCTPARAGTRPGSRSDGTRSESAQSTRAGGRAGRAAPACPSSDRPRMPIRRSGSVQGRTTWPRASDPSGLPSPVGSCGWMPQAAPWWRASTWAVGPGAWQPAGVGSGSATRTTAR